MTITNQSKERVLAVLMLVAALFCGPSIAAPILQPVDQTSEFVVVSGLPAQTQVKLLVNDVSFTQAKIDALDLDWASVGRFGNNLLDGTCQFWVGSFSNSGRRELLVYNATHPASPPPKNRAFGDHFILGSLDADNKLQWLDLGDVSGFGNLLDGEHQFWVGSFSDSGRSELLFYYQGNWWLGQVNSANKLMWKLVGNTSGQPAGNSVNFGNLSDGQHQFWVGAFTGTTQTQILFYFQGYWWLGQIDLTGQLKWTSPGNTSGQPAGNRVNFGDLADAQHRIWVGAFEGHGRSQILFYFEGDGNWWLGTIGTAGSFQWQLVGNSKGGSTENSVNFGNLLDSAHFFWRGNFTAAGQADMVMHYRGDGNWFDGSLDPTGKLRWRSLGNTKGFGDVTDTSHRFWVGNFGGTGRDELLFYNSGDSNWWRGEIGPQPLKWTLAGNTRLLGNLIDPQHAVWSGDFAAAPQSALLLYFSGDGSTFQATGNWWLGQFDNARLKLPHPLQSGQQLILTAQPQTGPSLSSNTVTVSHNYATQDYDRNRSGWNSMEPRLSRAAVRSFLTLQTLVTDDQVFAQPLYVENVRFSGITNPRNALYVVSERATAYAFDADSGELLATKSLIQPGEHPVPSGDIYAKYGMNIFPVIGTTGTPVIERATSSLFVVVKSKDEKGNYHQRIQHVDIATLSSRVDSGSEITGRAASGAQFDALVNNQRAGLLLSQGLVYVVFASHEDHSNPTTNVPWSGWVFAYDSATLNQQAVFDAEPTGGSGIWQSGQGPAADDSGSVFAVTGNSPTYMAFSLSNSVLKLSARLKLLDYFTPLVRDQLNNLDWDLASGGVMVIPDQAGNLPHLLITAGKQGEVYLLNRDDLGGFSSLVGSDNVIQEIKLYPDAVTTTPGVPAGSDANQVGMFGGPAYFGGALHHRIFICGAAGPSPGTAGQLVSYQLSNAQLMNRIASPGVVGPSTPFVTSNGTQDSSAVVWLIKRSNPLRLMAINADDFSDVLFTAPAGPWLNPEGQAFLNATVINGKAYVPSSSGITVFGQ